MVKVERYHQVHRGFAALNVGSVFAGLAYRDTAIDLNIILLAALFVLIRAKFWLDDESYLEDVGRGLLPGGLPFAFGLFLALISWLLWAFAGFFIKDVELCSLLMVLVFVVSSLWIVAAMVKRGAYSEQVPWLFFNALYGLGFALVFTRSNSLNPFRDSVAGFTTCVIVLLFIVFCIDLALTRILEQKRQSQG
jgi:hypothetical protein